MGTRSARLGEQGLECISVAIDERDEAEASGPVGEASSDVLFRLAPISLWLEDYSGVRAQLEAWRADGVTDLRRFLLDDLGRRMTRFDPEGPVRFTT